MCECDEIGSPWMLRLICRTVVFCEDAADLRFELGVKNSSEEAELVQVVVRKLQA